MGRILGQVEGRHGQTATTGSYTILGSIPVSGKPLTPGFAPPITLYMTGRQFDLGVEKSFQNTFLM